MKDKNKNKSYKFIINQIDQFLLKHDKQLLDGSMLTVIPITTDMVIKDILTAVHTHENVPKA